MSPALDELAPSRCGIDSVELARMERLVAGADRDELLRLFSATEIEDSGEGPARIAHLAARYAAKEACAKLFARELALGAVEPGDFAVERDRYGAPQIVVTAKLAALLARHRLSGINVSLTHDGSRAAAIALAVPLATEAPLSGRLLHALLPIRRRIVHENLRHVFGERAPAAAIVRLAQAHYAHLWRLAVELVRFRFMSARRKRALVRVENVDTLVQAFRAGKGVLVLTGHFGNWEVATVAGIQSYPEVRGRFHFVRRPIKPRWLDAWVTRRFDRAGFGVIGKRGSLDAIVERLEAGDVVVFPFDQFAARPDGIDVELFGRPVGTFRSLAILALATGAPVMPAASWREPDGSHVLRFEAPLPPLDHEDTNEAIRRNTRAYNAALETLILRHPEQWWWVHRRFRRAGRARRRAGAQSASRPLSPEAQRGGGAAELR
ncbi:MAG TPA: 4'-phosphopantetheinyl transferase superfamily protein [Casimicrobiaceae bacterium]|nr:4'-phosphopantetheinyl transferase superfamily protein [Casimicrobiaceae bacterium]